MRRHDGVVLVAPSVAHIARLLDALKFIARHSPADYRHVREHLRGIVVTRRRGYANEFLMPWRLWFVNGEMLVRNSVSWIASLIVHESFHATQWRKGQYEAPVDSHKLERPALLVQQRFLARAGAHDDAAAIDQLLKGKYDGEGGATDSRSYQHFRNLLEELSDDIKKAA